MALEGFSREEKEILFNDIFIGTIGPLNLPPNLYRALGLSLFASVVDGFGFKLAALADSLFRQGLLLDYQVDVFVFSAAKTFQQVKDMSGQVFKAGVKVPFNEFKKSANQIFGIYNETWLAVEQRTAVNLAFSGEQWATIQESKEDLPLLRFNTAGDARVRDSHAALDGTVKPVDDPFWDSFMPPIDWNCRCDTTQHTMEEVEVSEELKSSFEKPNKLFDMNPGKDRIIFRPDHPYQKVDQRFEVHKENNFGLSLP